MKRVLLCIVWLSVSIICAAIFSQDSGAQSTWGNDGVQIVGRAELFNAAPTSMIACPGFDSTIYTDTAGELPNACVFGTKDKLRIARYVAYGMHYYGVAFANEDTFYELRGVCEKVKCVYSPASDTVLTQRMAGQGLFAAEMRSNISQRLQRHFNPSTLKYYYEVAYDETQDSILESNQVIPYAESMAFSNNGQWAVIETRWYGIMRLNIQTKEFKRVITPGSTYGLFNDPYYELAVSNDGQYIATTGYRASTNLYEISNTCGDFIAYNSRDDFTSGAQYCRNIDLNVYATFPKLYHGFKVSFSDDASRLGISILNVDSKVERVIFAPKNSTNTPNVNTPKYLALGDSFTSGEGEANDSYYKEGTNIQSLKCHVSVRSYPYLVGQFWGVATQNVACSGARTVDIISPQNYDGQSGVLAGKDSGQRFMQQEQALGLFRPGVVPQSHFVSTYQPDVVSVGIGGNDVGLVGKLSACLMPGDCEWVADTAKKFATSQEIASVYPKIRQTLAQLQQSAPNTQYIVVGYPTVINDQQGAQCGALLDSVLSSKEKSFIQESIQYLNAVIQQAAHAQGVRFISEHSQFKQHTLCGSKDQTAMNSIRLGDDIAPLKIFEDFKVFGAESFHPTAKGHELTAQVIRSEFPAAHLVTACDSCTFQGAIPEPSDYWPQTQPDDYVKQVSDTSISSDVHIKGETLRVSTQKGTFMPGTQVKAQLHSDPQDLHLGVAGADGSVSFEAVALDAPKGYHTLHIFGESSTQQKVDIYKVIAVQDEPEVAVAGSTNPLANQGFGKTNGGESDTEDNGGSISTDKPGTVSNSQGTTQQSTVLAGEKSVLGYVSPKISAVDTKKMAVKVYTDDHASQLAIWGGVGVSSLLLSGTIWFFIRFARNNKLQDRGG